MVLAGHFERGGQGARAAGFYLRAAQQAVHVLDLDATFVRTALGLGCAPSPELRIALLGVRCEAAQGAQRVALAEAEELLDTAPRGSIPWAQGMLAYCVGMLVAGRIDDLLAQLALLREVTPAPDAGGWMSVVLLSGVVILDIHGHVSQATALEQPFRALVRARGDQEPLARVWWHVVLGKRASYAHDDPWAGLGHGDAIQPIFDAIGGEILFLNMQLLRGMNRWFLGALGSAAEALEAIPAADTAMGMASPLRRFVLSWLYADRGALDRARALALQLAEAGRTHGNPLEEGRGRWALAEVLRRVGDLEAADREIELALGMGVPIERSGMLATRTVLRLAQGRAAEALAAAEDAMAHCTAMGGCGMFRGAFVRLAHAEALHAVGAHDAARGAITRARAHLLAIADKIADPVYRASFFAHVPENARTLALAGAWGDQ
jgi:tetratricopeptide (TPR) repeat protein